MDKKAYSRVILKISGEALLGSKQFGIDAKVIEYIVCEVKTLLTLKVQVGLLVGGGNFFRGAHLNIQGISRITGDHLGMLATMMNAIAMRDIFRQHNVAVEIVSSLPVAGLLEGYDRYRVADYLQQGKVVIFAGGTGNPLVTTDTALCLRGVELDADLLLKATKVDGVYTSDPKKDSNAELYHKLDYATAISKKLAVIDRIAFYMGREHEMKICVFNLNKKGALQRIICGMEEGTLIE